MGRHKNQLSEVQLDSKLFEGICRAIGALGVDNVVTGSGVGRTSVFKYKRGEPIPRNLEAKIIAYLDTKKDQVKLHQRAKNIARAAMA